MIILAVLVAVVALTNPPSIFWITFLGGAIIASSWMPTAIASVFSKRLTALGASYGILFGFIACFAVKMISYFAKISLPVYFDPSIVGMVANVIGMIIGSSISRVTDTEIAARNEMFIIPQEEKNPVEVKKTLHLTKLSTLIGISVTVVLLVLWVVPYLMYR